MDHLAAVHPQRLSFQTEQTLSLRPLLPRALTACQSLVGLQLTAINSSSICSGVSVPLAAIAECAACLTGEEVLSIMVTEDEFCLMLLLLL